MIFDEFPLLMALRMEIARAGHCMLFISFEGMIWENFPSEPMQYAQ